MKCARLSLSSIVTLLGLLFYTFLRAQDAEFRAAQAATNDVPAAPDAALVQIAGERFLTDRAQARSLLMTDEAEQAFTFAVFGDRTGGPAEGIAVLKQAVAETNLLHPDLVMTVGDLIQGYNEADEWLVQMNEYQSTMQQLLCPWYPVAGNHDVYWRGAGPRPIGEHEPLYEKHFGPLWYAFRHKNAWFIALYSDEGDPVTGDKDFNQPRCQAMSAAQFQWLTETLAEARGAQHVFVFLHHPRWLKGGYGEDWERVHNLLAQAGNVSAVFAGHIHRMRYDGLRDGIEYFTLATVGGDQRGFAAQAGWLHQYTFVTVRKDGIATVAFPVGSALDPRAITGEASDESARLAQEFAPRWDAPLALAQDGGLQAELTFGLTNPAQRPLEIEYWLESDDAHWLEWSEPVHLVLAAQAKQELRIPIERLASALDASFRLPELVLAVNWLGEKLRVPLPQRRYRLPLDVSQALAQPADATEWALLLDGVDDALAIDSAVLALGDGPFTIEGWLNAQAWGERTGFINKTESGEFGLFVSGGLPSFSVHLDGTYRDLAYSGEPLALDQWHHLAGVFDGAELRLYVNGRLAAAQAASGRRTLHNLPLMLGADVGSRGEPTSLFSGAIDEIRISAVARYGKESFQPAKRHLSDALTRCLLHMEAFAGPAVLDAAPSGAHARLLGQARRVALEGR